MKISKEQFDKIASLCRLEIDPNQKEELMNDMEMILDWVEKLDEVDTSDVEPLVYMNSEVNRVRKDKIRQELNKGQALLNAPDHDDTFFRVPKVINRLNE